MIKHGAAPALERGLNILELLRAERQRGATLAVVRQRLKIPIASAYRILGLLERRGHVWQDEAGRYFLSMRQIMLGFAAHSVSPLVCAAQPLLREIAAQTHEMSELAVRSGRWELAMLDTWQTEGTPLRIRSRPGLTFELAPTTPHGHCFLAFGAPRMLEEFRRVPAHRRFLDARKFGELSADRDLWRKLGYAWRRKTGPGDIARIAAPVFDPHAAQPLPLATLGIALETARLTTFRVQEWGRLLKRMAGELERRIGG